MKFDVSLVISVLAILVMFYCLWLVLSLRKNVPGGVSETPGRRSPPSWSSSRSVSRDAVLQPAAAGAHERDRLAHLPVRRDLRGDHGEADLPHHRGTGGLGRWTRMSSLARTAARAEALEKHDHDLPGSCATP